MYKGHVYLKETSAPVSGICVTDGRNIVRTDINGAFELPGWERAHIISVGVLTKCHSDWYSRIEDHEGDFDFYITPAETDGGHCFLHISDTEITHGCGTWLSYIKRCVQEDQPGFLIQTGDICRAPGLSNHYKEMNYETMGCPVRYTLGNHDYVDDRYGEYTFEMFYGPVWYSFDYGNIHYIIMPMKSGDAPACYQREDSDIWLKKDLEMKESGRKVIFFCHDLFSPDEDGFTTTVQGEPLHLKDYDLLAWCFGHFHIHFCNDVGGCFNICTSRPYAGGIDSSPAAVRKTSIDNNGELTSTMLYYDIKKAVDGDPGVWRTQLDGRILYSSPVYAEGMLFTATFNDGFPKNTAVYALDAGNGTILWKYDTFCGIKGELAYADGKVYAQDGFGWVYCLNARDGGLIWKKLIDLNGYPHHTNQNVLVENGVVFAGCSRKVTAVNASDGTILWSSNRTGRLEGCPSRFVLCGDKLIVSAQWYGVYALDIKTGIKIWENRNVRYRSSTTGVWGKYLYVTSTSNLILMDSDTGAILYSYIPLPKKNFNTSGIPVRDGDDLFICTAESGVIRYNGVSLQETAEYPCGPSIVSASPYVESGSYQAHGKPLLENGQLIFSAADGYLHIYNVEDGDPIHAFHAGAPLFTSPVRAGEYLIAADFNGRITAYKW